MKGAVQHLALSFRARQQQILATLKSFESTEYFKRLGLRAAAVESYEDFASLPLMGSELLGRYFEQLAIGKEECIAVQSSGTTGRRKTVYVPRDERCAPLPPALDEALKLSACAVTAHSKRDRVERFYWVHERSFEEWYPRAALVEYSDVESVLRAARGEILVLYDYPSSVEYFLYTLERISGVADRRAIAKRDLYIELAGEPVTRERVAQIAEAAERVFGVEPLIEVAYGASETGLIGVCEDPHRGIEYAVADRVFVEVVDKSGNPLPPGHAGEVVVTPLTTKGTILVRYRLGDLGSLALKGGRLVLELLGRIPGEDVVYICGGKLHVQRLAQLLREELEIPVKLRVGKLKRELSVELFLPPSSVIDEELAKRRCLSLICELAELSSFDLAIEPVNIVVEERFHGGKEWSLAQLTL
jgi:phenylacetate-coenzyme A ligase PaaK-like adenylate-forming protein